MLEFLVAFVPVFVLFLGLLQLVLLAAADLVVRHAAILGVRAAVVVLFDDPAFYAGSAQGDARDTPGEASRIAAIRRAVHAPLAALAPGASEVSGAATTVAFPSAPEAADLLEDLSQAQTITVRVTRRVPCAIPLAGWLLCKRRRLSSHAELPLALLQAEASMPAQAAPYPYPSERTTSRAHAAR
jgi:hypothetical protein